MEENDNTFEKFITFLKFIYIETTKDIQIRFNQFIGEELTDLELNILKKELEYAFANIGFVMLVQKLTVSSPALSQEELLNAYLLTMYVDPICGEKVIGIDNPHSKDFHQGFLRYFQLRDLQDMINEICIRTREADKGEDFFVTTGKDLRITILNKILAEVIFPLTYSSLKDFLDKN
jgi:hypothetical protein